MAQGARPWNVPLYARPGGGTFCPDTTPRHTEDSSKGERFGRSFGATWLEDHAKLVLPKFVFIVLCLIFPIDDTTDMIAEPCVLDPPTFL